MSIVVVSQKKFIKECKTNSFLARQQIKVSLCRKLADEKPHLQHGQQIWVPREIWTSIPDICFPNFVFMSKMHWKSSPNCEEV